jgi:proline iminopeptidase
LAVEDETSDADMQTRLLQRQGEPWYDEAARALEMRPETDGEMAQMLKTILPLYWSDPAKAVRFQKDFVSWVPSAHAFAAAFASRRYPYDLRQQLEAVTVPTLIVVGDDDFICSPRSATEMHLALRNSKLLLIEQAGHFPWMEQPEVFEARVTDFLHALGLAGR